MAETYECFKVEVADYVATVTLARPPVNAQNRRFREEIIAIFDTLSDRTDVRGRGRLNGQGRLGPGSGGNRRGPDALLGVIRGRLVQNLDERVTRAVGNRARSAVGRTPDTDLDDETVCIRVNPGDRLPGIPRHRFKVGVDYWVTNAWTVGADLVAALNRLMRRRRIVQRKPCGNRQQALPGRDPLSNIALCPPARRMWRTGQRHRV